MERILDGLNPENDWGGYVEKSLQKCALRISSNNSDELVVEH